MYFAILPLMLFQPISIHPFMHSFRCHRLYISWQAVNPLYLYLTRNQKYVLIMPIIFDDLTQRKHTIQLLLAQSIRFYSYNKFQMKWNKSLKFVSFPNSAFGSNNKNSRKLFKLKRESGRERTKNTNQHISIESLVAQQAATTKNAKPC